jgi:hypothetical protein
MVAGFFSAKALDLDYLGSHAGQNLCASGAGLVASQIDHTDIFQWMIESGHGWKTP